MENLQKLMMKKKNFLNSLGFSKQMILNNYVLAQMDLILTLGKTINKEETLRIFIKQLLPKLFGKFYLSNPKTNYNLIEILEQSFFQIKDPFGVY